MRILYCATDQFIPGMTGGAIHVLNVAIGLARRGHDVHVAAGRTKGPVPDSRVTWHALGAPLHRPHLRLLRTAALRRLADTLHPDIVIERYHNFGGEGVLAARGCGAPVLLEVNAPVVDYRDSPKRRLDRALVVEPLRRWREWQCKQAALIVTPSREILPPWVDDARVLEMEWGADVERFHPGARGPLPFTRGPNEIVAVFAGAFRPWHGAHLLADALVLLAKDGQANFHGVFIGDGPELPRVRAIAEHLPRVTFTGAIAHDDMPAALAAADIGVAPFDIGAHPPLQLGFYWSPLKIFEYMASGLPIVAPQVRRLSALFENGREGIAYDPPDARHLAAALRMLSSPATRAGLGSAGRDRVVRQFSWQAHCARLDSAIQQLISARNDPGVRHA